MIKLHIEEHYPETSLTYTMEIPKGAELRSVGFPCNRKEFVVFGLPKTSKEESLSMLNGDFKFNEDYKLSLSKQLYFLPIDWWS